jgi:hypothetical protein
LDAQHVEKNEELRAELDEWSVCTAKVSNIHLEINKWGASYCSGQTDSWTSLIAVSVVKKHVAEKQHLLA